MGLFPTSAQLAVLIWYWRAMESSSVNHALCFSGQAFPVFQVFSQLCIVCALLESGTAKSAHSVFGKINLNKRHCTFHHDLWQLSVILSALFPAVSNTQSLKERQCSSHQGNPLDKIILSWSASSKCKSECESVFSCLYTMRKKMTFMPFYFVSVRCNQLFQLMDLLSLLEL